MQNNHDKILLKILSLNDKRFNNWKVKKAMSLPNIKKYIENRYSDTFSYKETLMRMKLKIDSHPKCFCGNYVKFTGKYNNPFLTYCSKKCNAISKERKEKIKETSLKKYGVDSPNKVQYIKDKKVLSFKSKYNVDNPSKIDFVKDKKVKTTLKHYGVDNPSKSPEIKDKKVKTYLKKYGVLNSFQIRKYTKEEKAIIQERIYKTKKKNHTFNTSKPEEQLFLYIKERFPAVKRQYKDKERYPYFCDFYIPELDYFIELQGYYTHGKHPFNPNSKEDQILIERYKEKYGENCQAITIWTIKDVEKRNCARKHNLNFKEVWSLSEGQEFIDNLIFLYNQQSEFNS